MIGVHANNDIIITSDGRSATTNYMDFLLTLDNVAFYDMDATVASLLHKIELTESESYKLRDTCRLFLVIEGNSYKLTYFPGKFFSINRGAGSNRAYVSCYNCKQFTSVHYEKDTPLEFAQSALKTASSVLASYRKIGVKNNSLVSPISAFVKADRYPNVAKLEDIPQEVAELSYSCLQGNWLESYKLGSFPMVYDYDIRGAYGFELCNILDTRRGEWIQDNCIPDGAIYGFANGTLKTDSPFSQFLYGNGEMRYTPTGTREATVTKQELDFIRDYSLGSFECHDGWWWIPTGPLYNPFKGVVTYLWNLRKDADPLTDKIIKRIISGIWGYCSQTKGSGDNLSFGDYFNPVVASIVETNCRLKVARTVLDNDLFPDLINVCVDGLVTTKPIPVGNGEMGSWRLTHQGKGLSVSSGIVGIEGKGGDEDFSISYDKLYEMFTANPEAQEYTMEKYSPCTLAKAMNEKDLSRLGVLELITRKIIVEADVKRVYSESPCCGRDILNNVYESKPVDVSLLLHDFSNIKKDDYWDD